MACPGASWLVVLLRRADERAGDHSVPAPSGRSLAPRHPAAGTEASACMAANEGNRQSLPALSAHPASVAGTTVSRQSSEVGARCGSAARRDLCGGRPQWPSLPRPPRTASSVPRWWSLKAPSGREPSVGKSIIDTSSVTRVGLDLAKRVFRVHAIDATGFVVIARSVNRRTLLNFFDALPRCVVAMEACSSAHHWGEFAAFLGLTPREHSTGGKPRLGRITKMGDRYLRKLLVVGACSALAARKGHNDALRRWASGMLERKTVKYKFKLTAVALANKLARIVYALATKGGHYDDRPVAA